MKTARYPDSPRLISVRPLAREDLAALQSKRIGPVVKKLRDSHHIIARLLSSGLSQTEVAAQVGFSASRISLLASDPSVRELINKYRADEDAVHRESRDEFYQHIYSNGLKAQRMIADRLDDADEADEPIPLNRLLAIAADSADRVGYTKKSTTFNVNVDFAAKLERARQRSSLVIDAE